MQINKPFLAILVITVLSAGLFLLMQNKDRGSEIDIVNESNDAQMIEISVKGGYVPANIRAKADKETVIKFKTNNTYDCSSSVFIYALGIRELLPITGEKTYVVPADKAKGVLEGGCSMGHYRFTINFV